MSWRPREGERVEDACEPGRLGTAAGPVSSDGFESGVDVDWDDGDRTWDELGLLKPLAGGDLDKEARTW